MKLSQREFKAMNHPLRRFLQRNIEFPLFLNSGLEIENLDVLEIGCGSGYGAVLLSRLNPKSYQGVDLMPEQIKLAIELAKRYQLDEYEFSVEDATNLSSIPDESKDVVVIFGILHHISLWREVICECNRVLRVGGKIFLEEPDGASIEAWDKVFKWGHPDDAAFRLKELEAFLIRSGFSILKQRKVLSFGVYAAQKR